MQSPHKLLHQLLDYIAEQAKDIDLRGYLLGASKGYVLRRESISGLPGVEFDLKVEGDHIWLRVQRLEANKPPVVHEKYRVYIRVSNDPNGHEPFLDEAAFLHRLNVGFEGKSPEERSRIEIDLRARVSKVLETYTLLWKSWAHGEQPRRRTISLYGDLFSLKHQLEAEETVKPQEFVWGIGIMSWKIPFENDPIDYEYPFLTQAIEISMDEETMGIEIRPRVTETRVEMDALIACQVASAIDVESTARAHLAKHKDRPVTPFDPSNYSDVLKLAATNLDSKGGYREILAKGEQVPAPAEHLIVTDGWAIFSRPRSKNYLFEDLKRLQEKLEKGCEIPLGPLALVTPPSDKAVKFDAVHFRGISSRGNSNGKPVQELYFPLPYNEEQVTIVQRLEKAPGVAVQGPPGTGKTHTIANIICHYLATGCRVLVTSRGEPALEVLQSKIPEEIRPLTVALLANDREGLRQFRASIEAIQHRVSQLNPEQTSHEIKTIKAAIDRAHSELLEIDGRIEKIAVAQLSEVSIDGIPMRPQKLAELVVSGREQYDWFDDSINLEDKNKPPLSDEEGGKLREARRKLGADLVYAQTRIPSADDLLATKDIVSLHEILSHLKTIEGEVARGEILSLKAATPEILETARDLLGKIEEAHLIVQELESFEERWPFDLRTKCRQPSFASERQALEALFADLEVLVQSRAEFLKRPVEFPEDGLLSVKTREAVSRGAENGRPFGILAFGNGDAKAHIASTRVAGLVPSCAEDWAHVLRFLKLHEQTLSFLVRWNQFAMVLSIPSLEGGVTILRHVELVATAAKKAHRLATHYDAVLLKKADAVFDKPPSRKFVENSNELSTVRECLLRHLTRAGLSRAATELSSLQEKLAGKSGPVVEVLRTFIEKELGNPTVAPARAAASYAEIIAELRRVAGLSFDLACVRDFAKRIEDSGSPKLAHRIRSQPVDPAGEDRVFPATWKQAWNWARIHSYLDGIEAREKLLTLSARRRDLESALARLYKEMVAKAAWLATKGNATPRVLQALAGYATAIRRIGQGTGPNATRYRRDARESMLDAAGSVPCWIMSHSRISESMPADIGAFDLVIVDEASQSDLWALPAILRGKRILVVGDDKQVSPDAGFIDSQHIQQLKGRFLSDQPYGTEMTPEKSLYDLAARVFAAYQVMLREHFRCVPSIIAYSNRVFYKNAIQPLRIPKASERIDPPLVDIYIPDGIRNAHDCNEQEAEAIVQEITALLKDERFSERTIGVVSLFGSGQAKFIDSIVRDRCDAADLLSRKFLCGDARTFQGSERDIMFLSLVVDQANSHAVSGNIYEQRFNVAASRARDRMYLVRSVSPSNLSDKDLRLTLLAHFDNPMVTDKEETGTLVDLCESSFERQVFSELSTRGYHVVPQVKTGSYRIDMVVEGVEDTRLAIECDGDDFHGPDRWTHDMNRQRVLERAGWTFWRCFASTWTLRKEDVMVELLERLNAMGIEPLGAVDRIASQVEKRIWKPAPFAEGQSDEIGLTLENTITSVQKSKGVGRILRGRGRGKRLC